MNNINANQNIWDTPLQAGAAAPSLAPAPQLAYTAPKAPDTEHTRRMKQNFNFFGPATFLYAMFYAFCLFRNSSGATFPFFMAGSLLYLCFTLAKLEISLKSGSAFYMVSMMLLSVSTFCTDDRRIIAFNKTGIFLLMMSLLLKQFFDTSKWKLGKYLGAIIVLVFASIGEIDRPFTDAASYWKNKGSKQSSKIWYAVLGAVIALPLFMIVLLLLNSADAVFRSLTGRFLESLNIGNIFNVLLHIVFLYFSSYMLTAYLCRHRIKEEVKEQKNGEPILAITITGILSLLYLLFCGIQIVYLFLGKMQLPEGYTYASYAREGFFQLLAVSILNLIIVLTVMRFFRDSKVLNAILTIMSFCTFIMIASSALRMIIYIRYYDMTFLRILVLWSLAVLFLLFSGVAVNIFRPQFPLFQYSMVVVTILYLMLSFGHPDYIIARVNVANAPGTEGESHPDYYYLSQLSADAAPVLIPYLADLGYDMNVFYENNILASEMAIIDGEELNERGKPVWKNRATWSGFGCYYLESLQEATENFSLRTFNVSRYMALKQIEKYAHSGA